MAWGVGDGVRVEPRLPHTGAATTLRRMSMGSPEDPVLVVTWSNRRLEYFGAIRNVYIVYPLLPRNTPPSGPKPSSADLGYEWCSRL